MPRKKLEKIEEEQNEEIIEELIEDTPVLVPNKEILEDKEYCPNCNEILTAFSVAGGKKFCSDKCANEYLNL